MKNITKILLSACFMPVLFSCDYERINTNPYEMTDEEGVMDGVAVGAKIMLMERSVIPVGTFANQTDYVNRYQTAYHLSVDGWAGYFGQDGFWENGSNSLTYSLVPPWTESTYKETYTECLPAWKKIKEFSDKNNTPEYYALAQILKISTWHKNLESFGPIPYSEAGGSKVDIPFDSEKDAYNYMFNDLKDAIDVLKPLAETGSSVMSEFDAVYAGSAQKWVKYANSLMLRLAMRLKFVAPELSRQWAMEAYGNNIENLICKKAEEAQMSNGAGYLFKNNIQHCAVGYNETKMCTSMWAYLNGYNDPRLSVYFTEEIEEDGKLPTWSMTAFDGKKYAPVPPGTAQSAKTFAGASRPNFTESTPTYWLRASEVYFLLAEAALEWGEFGNASDWYEAGVKMSFEENGLSGAQAEDYLESRKTPCEVNIKFGSKNYSRPKPTNATPSFEQSNKEKALEQIMIQKWIALYPNGMEAWTEWRRTGYPKLNTIMDNKGGVDASTGIRRFNYPTEIVNSAQYKETVLSNLPGSADKVTTRLWWDVR